MSADAETSLVPPNSWRELFRGANGVRAIILCSGVALHAINLYLATTVMPSIVREIGGVDYYAWNTSLFVVGSILGAALAPHLMRHIGCRLALLSAVIVFAVGCAICAASPDMPWLIAGRFVQGVGGGLLLSLPYALINLLFSPALWPRAMAMLSSMWGVATLLGPALGGLLAELGIWRIAFASLVPASLLLGLFAVPLLPARANSPLSNSALPLAQLTLLSAAVLAISFVSVAGDSIGKLAGTGATVVLLFWLHHRESTSNARLLPRGALGHSPLRRLYISMALLALTVTCSEIFMPWFLQELHGLGPLAAGLIAATMSAGWTAGSIIASGADARRARICIRAAPWLSVVGLIAIALLLPLGTSNQWSILVAITVALIGVGFAVGIAWPHLATRVMEQALPAESDLAASSIMTVQLVGTAFSASAAGIIVNLAGMSEVGGAGSSARWLFALCLLAPLWLLFTDQQNSRSPSISIRE